MRPLPQTYSGQGISRCGALRPFAAALAPPLLFFALSVFLAACGGGSNGSGGSSTPPPPLTQISVSITPGSGSVLLGETLSFSAMVSNTSNPAVTWSVNNIPGGTPQVGVISADGVYIAPPDLPSNGKVQVTATSQADPTKSASANVAITSDIVIALSPNSSSIELGAWQPFYATITTSGKPDQSLHWTVSGAACPGSCGSIDVNGNYTAPPILPFSPNVIVTATSAADPSKQASALLTITSHFTLQVAAPSSLQPGSSSTIVATLTPQPGSNPSSALSWALSGSGCSGSACGVLSVVTTQSAGGSAVAGSATYTAPLTPPQPSVVVITVTPQADPAKQTQTSILIQSGPSLGLAPLSFTLAANHRVTLTASENGTSGEPLAWSVNGIPGGNTTTGQICVVASSPCQAVTGGSTTQVDYIAPGAIPSPNPVSVQVRSSTNSALSASSQITVINHLLVSVFPNNIALPPLAVRSFTATVLGTTNPAVIWQVRGTGCGASGACGSVTQSGVYTAPAAPPSPNSILVVAVSQDDTSQSGSAGVSVSNGVNILELHPASIYAGSANGFTLSVDGSGFVLSNPGPGSTLLIDGTPRVTTCNSANSCSAPVDSTDVGAAGGLSVQVKNPNGALSNTVSLVVFAPGTSDVVISLTPANPTSAGNNITVVEPSTAGGDADSVSFDLDVAALGVFVTATNACNLGGNPVPLVRPANGTSAAEICLFSQSGFDTSMRYTVSGPGDVAVIAKQPAGLGIIHLTLQIPSTAAPGARTLFIQNANLDKTAASGALEIQ